MGASQRPAQGGSPGDGGTGGDAGVKFALGPSRRCLWSVLEAPSSGQTGTEWREPSQPVPARPRRGGAAAFEFEVAPGQAGELLSSAEGTKISIEDVDWGVTGAEGMGDL